MIRALASAAALLVACGDDREPTGSAGQAAGAAIAATMTAAEAVSAPWRCALAPAPGVAPATGSVRAGERTWQRDGEVVRVERGPGPVTIAAVAQARGASPAVKDALRAAGVDLVVAVGGMGASADELRASLGALVDPGWLTVAVPGDVEAWPVLGTVVAELATAGAPLVEAGSVRLIDAGGAVVAALPGQRHPSQLAMGSDGCVHDEDDRLRLLGLLTAVAGDRPRVLVGVAAPQGGPSDLAPGGVHAGEPALTRIAAALDVTIHAPLDAAPRPPGKARFGEPVVLAAGSLDPVPRFTPEGRRLPTGLTVVTVDGRGAAWRFVPVAVP